MTTDWSKQQRRLMELKSSGWPKSGCAKTHCMATGDCRTEQLGRDEHARFKAVRLHALIDAPEVFGTTVAEVATWSSAKWRQQLEQMTSFVAVRSTKDVGLVRCVLHPEADTASLISLWVAPEARGAGIAGQLIQAVIRFAREHKMGRVVLDVVSTNTEAIALYRKHGFVPNGERAVLVESCRMKAERQFELLL